MEGVIELGDDGCFEVPSPTSGSTGVVNSLGSTYEIEDNTMKPVSINQLLFDGLLDQQYRIYKTRNTNLVIMMKVSSSIKNLRLGKKLLVVETTNNNNLSQDKESTNTTANINQPQYLKIPLPFDVQTNTESVECKCFESYAIINLKLC